MAENGSVRRGNPAAATSPGASTSAQPQQAGYVTAHAARPRDARHPVPPPHCAAAGQHPVLQLRALRWH